MDAAKSELGDRPRPWTAEEIKERLKRRKMVDEEMLAHAQSTAGLIAAEHDVTDGGEEDVTGCGVPPGDVAVGAVAALLQMWEGGEPPVHCFPAASGSLNVPPRR